MFHPAKARYDWTCSQAVPHLPVRSEDNRRTGCRTHYECVESKSPFAAAGTLGKERGEDSSCKWFTVFDLNAAFHQIAFSSEQDAELAAFVTEDGLYQMRAMPFGITNAPTIMQRLIDRVLAPHKKYALAPVHG
jgi:hypothetical protein